MYIWNEIMDFFHAQSARWEVPKEEGKLFEAQL